MDQATQLRNIIKQSQQRPLARVITVTSGKGGVGKTSVSVNLAIQLQKMGNRVVILDTDFGLANIEVMLGIRPKYNLGDLIFKGKSIREIITPGPFGVGFISGGSGIQELNDLSKEQIQIMLQKLCELDEIADIIIVDTGAGINESVLGFVTASSEVLLVVTPEPTSITDAYALLKALDKRVDFQKQDTTIRMISNRVEGIAQGHNLYHKLSTVVNEFLNLKLEFLGTIPQDHSCSKAIIQQTPVTIAYPNANSSQAIFNLAVQINNKGVTSQTEKKGVSNFFARLVRRVGR